MKGGEEMEKIISALESQIDVLEKEQKKAKNLQEIIEISEMINKISSTLFITQKTALDIQEQCKFVPEDSNGKKDVPQESIKCTC